MMKGKMIPTLLAAGVTALAGTSALADEELIPENPQQDGAAVVDDETPTLWFVELTSAPTADGTSSATVRAEQSAFRSAANAAGIDYTERFAFEALFNGLSVEVPRGEAESLARVAGVRQLWPVIHIKAADDESSVPDMFTALNMTGANIAQSSLGLTGAGVRVAIMDTGVDYHHPDLGGCFGPGCRVEAGWDFVGDAFNADPASPAFNPVAVPDPFPDDCNGHGSHVAGIAGANGTIRGVAPGITYGAYRVFGCEGSTTADIMLAAMEMALADDMDVLNMSIGAAFQWPQYPTARGADRLVSKGMVVTASIGNSGANGLYSASAPGLGKKVIGVANFVNTHSALRHFTVSPDDRQVGYNQATASPTAPLAGSGLLARTGTPASAADACNTNPPAAGSLAGRIALVRRGTCGFHEKALNAQNAGAIAVVLYNNAAGRVNPTVAGTPAITIPVVAITAADGVVMNDRIAAGPVTLTWRATFFSEPVGAGAGLISASSSYGLGADLSMKPDIGAPGGLIMSTIPLENGGFGSNSGTSMAAPHIAGAAALMLQRFPNMSAAQIQTRLQNTADPQVWAGNPGLGFLDNVHRQGAGLADIDDAITTTTALEPAQIELGEREGGAPVTVELTLRNRSNQHVTYTLGHQPALATGANTFVPSFLSSFATVTFAAPTVVVAPHDEECFTVTFTPPVNANARLFGGYVTATPDNGEPVTRASYGGYNGDYQAIQVLVPTANNFPWLAKVSGTTFTNQPGGATYTMVGQDTPQFVAHFDHQVRRLRIDIYNVATGKLVGRSHNQQYLGRNSGATTFFAFAWDGMVQKGPNTFAVPNGTYRAELSVLKALGDESNPAHTERWTSPNITIARP
jgi:minor extracellular serine protease Vpr